MTNRAIAAAVGAAAAFFATSAIATSAGAETAIKFTLDWKFQGPTAAFFVAEDQGYFKEEGLEVSIDSGNGSAGAVTRVASGAYQMGFADINSLVEFNVANPGQAVKAVMMVYDAAPFGLYTLKSSGITKPADLVGKKLGAPVFDASYKLFPAFAAEVGIDPAAVLRVNMDPPLREAMLVRGDVDVDLRPLFQLDARHPVQGRDEGRYRLHALQGLRHGLLRQRGDCRRQVHRRESEAVAGFNKAVAKAWKWVAAEPGEGRRDRGRRRPADRP